MPMWTIYHTPNVFSDNEKDTLANDIADIYTAVGLPRFYVVTVFSEIPATNFYVGGKRTGAAVRIVVDHIARQAPNGAVREAITRRIGKVLAPFMDKADLHWEFHVDETSEELWMINGLVPPPMNSEAEKQWARANASSPYEVAVS